MFAELSNVLVLNFSGMENTVFFNEKVDVRWYFSWHGILCLLITGNSLIGTFQRFKILSFLTKKLMRRLYLFYIFELFMTFQDLGNMVFIPDINTRYKLTGKFNINFLDFDAKKQVQNFVNLVFSFLMIRKINEL